MNTEWKPGDPTILTSPPPAFTETDPALERAKAMLEMWTAAYAASEVDLETMCKGIKASANACGLPIHTREKWLGYAVRGALDGPAQRKKPRKNAAPKSFQRVAIELVKLVHGQEGAPLSRAAANGTASAFDLAAKAFVDAGYPRVTTHVVRKWWENRETELSSDL